MERSLPPEEALLFHLASAYHALALSAVAPVILPSEQSGLGGAFSFQYYDTFVDPENARSLVKKRTKIASHDIARHFELHDAACEEFYCIEEFLNVHNPSKLYNHTNHLCRSLFSYQSIVYSHMRRLKEEAFLFYPFCISGHVFCPTSSDGFYEHSFNKPHSQPGFDSSVCAIKNASKFLLRKKAIFAGRKLTDLRDTGEGMDNSLRGRIVTAKELLRRAEQ